MTPGGVCNMANRLIFAAMLVVLGGCAARSGSLKPALSADAAATPVLWRDPGDIASRDLFWGAGASARAPQGPFTFVEEDTTGTNPKITVKDARGETWDIKFDEEVHAEVAANRLVWALGYMVEHHYFVPDGMVSGATGLTRAAKHVGPDGAFTKARFRWRNPATPRTEEEWTMERNPFVGSKELSGLFILMTLVNNWDIMGPRNNKVLRATLPDGRVERWFLVSDLGATFGRMGGGVVTNHTKWNLEHFRAEPFIEQAENGRLNLAHDGYDPDLDKVPIEHARWFAGLAAQLTPAQIRRAFEAAGATPQEIEGYTAKLVEKIAELKKSATD
jgi:hypothetical protein